MGKCVTDSPKKTKRKKTASKKTNLKKDQVKVKRKARPKKQVRMVAIGASAGGLEPFERFFDSMPVNSGAAFAVIQHLSPDFESMMDELLSRHSSMTIKRVINGLIVEPNTIYLNPPRSDMIVKDGKFILSPRPKNDQLNLPIDIFFSSLAEEYGQKAIAIVLSGTGSDGTRGAAEVKNKDGVVLVQLPASAKFDGMPRSVIGSGNFDAISTPSKMPNLIARVIKGELLVDVIEDGVGDDPAKYAFSIMREKFGTDFGYYKEATLRRRFDRRAQLFKGSPEAYARSLENNLEELEALYADLLIDVTAFFRDTKGFEAILKHAVHPFGKKMTHDRQIRIWIPGCSSGEEAYSFAIAFAEYARENNLPLNVKILATDIHKRSLGKAGQGIYPLESLKGLTEEQIDRYFEKHVDHFQVNQNLRRLVVFSQHNLLRDPPFTRMDIVSCRNVLIYFQEDAQKKTLALFHFALAVEGVLFLGPSESLGQLIDEFETLDRRWNIYRKLRDVRLVEASTLLPRDSENNRAADLSVPFLTGRGASLQRFQRAHSEALELLVSQYAPSGFLLNRKGEIVHVFGEAGEFVRIDGGMFSNKLIDLIDDQLRLAVTTGLERLTSGKTRHYERTVILVRDGNVIGKSVIVALRQLSEKAIAAGHLLLTLAVKTGKEENAGLNAPPKLLDTNESSLLLQQRIVDLESDLQATEESLQSLVEELQTSNEELQATNEELMASNEELQSTNEELHSVNEELYTVSAEHQRKIDELTILSDDMEHLMQATSLGIIFLDEHRLIRRFTPPATKVFNLLPQDVGRPFKHTTYKFDSVNLNTLMDRVEKKGEAIDQEIVVDGHEYFLTILPYDTSIKGASGMVMTLIDVSELKRVDRKRLEEKEIFEAVVNDLSQGILRVNLSDKNVEISNQAFANNFNKKVENIVGKPLADVIGKKYASQYFKTVSKYKAGATFQDQIVINSGAQNEKVMARTFRIIGDNKDKVVAFQATDQDITEEYRYAEALEALIAVEDSTELNFDQAVQQVLQIGCKYLHLPSAMSAIIKDGKITVEHVHGQGKTGLTVGHVSDYKNSFCNYFPNDFEALSISHVGTSRLKSKSCYKDSSIETYIGLRTFTSEGAYGVISFTDQKPRIVEFTEMELTMTQLLSRTIGALLERKLQRLSLEERHRELEDLNEGLNRFTYLASHDLQEPLRKIQQSGELLSLDYKNKLDKEGQYFLDIMTESAGRMRSLIEDLLLYSASANEKLEKNHVDINTLVEAARSDLSESIKDSGATFTVKALPIAACDKAVMTQVISNIIGNSLKYIEPGKKPKITISSKTLKKETRIEIKDNGIGMDIKPNINIFEPFVRLHSKSEYKGSGIGLAICKSVCDRHGWDIKAKSQKGKGTSMIISIPNSDII